MKEQDTNKKEVIKKNDFIELEFTGYSEGKVFDSNIEEDLKQVSKDAKPQKSIIIVSQKMVVPGLDKAIEGKEIGKEYNIDLSYEEGFGARKRELVKTIPLKVFTQQKINPSPGATLMLDNHLAKIITISGARVVTDFNNPLSGKPISYKFKIKRKVTESKEKAESFFTNFMRFVPKLEEEKDKIILKGPKILEQVIETFKPKFKELVGLDLGFKEEAIKENPPKEKQDKKD
jgi:FKBP-type peptidyl-prolyl cis-trans isomerase 2|tara:strand:+ start:1034 stop:1729 length:696 start_codon:yes stop_codon:yes gene_type:complete